MTDLNLVLKFQLAGEDQFQVRGAARIKIDGSGMLLFYDVQSGATEKIQVDRLQSFSMLSVNPLTSQSPFALPN